MKPWITCEREKMNSSSPCLMSDRPFGHMLSPSATIPDEVFRYHVFPHFGAYDRKDLSRLKSVCKSWCQAILFHLWRHVEISSWSSLSGFLRILGQADSQLFCPYGMYVESISIHLPAGSLFENMTVDSEEDDEEEVEQQQQQQDGVMAASGRSAWEHPETTAQFHSQMLLQFFRLVRNRFPRLLNLQLNDTSLSMDHIEELFCPSTETFLLTGSLQSLQLRIREEVDVWAAIDNRHSSTMEGHLRNLSIYQNLRQLEFGSSNLTDDAWSTIVHSLSKLMVVRVFDYHPTLFTERSLVLLAECCPELRVLGLPEDPPNSRNPVDDNVVAALAEHSSQLTRLSIPWSKISDRSMERFTIQFHHLEQLDIRWSHSEVTKEAVDAMLAAKAIQGRLRVVEVHGCDFDEHGILHFVFEKQRRAFVPIAG